MALIFGIIKKKGGIIDETILTESKRAMSFANYKHTVFRIGDHVAFGKQVINNPEISQGEAPFTQDKTSGCCIVSDCRIDYREELALKLEMGERELVSMTDDQLILNMYLKWGKDCLKYLFGDFSFAIWDPRQQELFCARDHLGCRPFYYYSGEEYFVFSNSLKGFTSIPGFDFSFDPELLPYYFTSTVLPGNRTAYAGIFRLAGSHSISLLANGQIVIAKYWDLEFNEKYSLLSIDEAIETFFKLIKGAVYERIKSSSHVGVELSGGLDSSSIAAIANDVKPDSARLSFYTHALSEEQKKAFHPHKDESHLSRLMVDHLGNGSHHLITGEGLRGGLDSLLNAMDVTQAPVVQLFPVMSDLLLECAGSDNTDLLLSGFGGDEGVTFQARSIRNELMEEHKWNDLFDHLRHQYPEKSIRSYIVFGRLFLIYMLKRMFPTFLGLRYKRSKQIDRNTLVVNTALLKPWKASIKALTKYGLKEQNVRGQQKERLFKDHVSDRLENSYHLAQSKGIAYAYPLLDVKVLNFVYSLPSEYKNFHGQGRYLMRKAMEGLVPDDIRLRNDKFGAAIPNVFYRLHSDIERWFELIEEGQRNNNFHYLDYEKLRSLAKIFSSNKHVTRVPFGKRIFFSSMSILILQKWQREGKIDIGIKC